ncbi:MAG: hypothetical protein A2161_16490 [Candidatus Schekmanbacteria bacterium RBG_13_48_7]|uniref:Type II secretion system protein GspI C-terminal domain-containing protein n=1 Tax=Candidatus Schekmanbacteria bacterium RBG_13_48_7 TaxID=1817878 RepID=A0A1F7RWC8_9BACT|nr:MAG: hypothetical protein A2161_16490 [Candidatus Schekmanbacteria bacterium RBG_13_48_7]
MKIKCSSGFTLIEILISIAIFCIVIVSVIQLGQDSVYRQQIVADYTCATLAASSQLEYLKTQEIKLPVPYNIPVEFAPDENMNVLRNGKGTYHYEEYIPKTLCKIVVVVSWNDFKKVKKQIQLSALKGVAVNAEQE